MERTFTHPKTGAPAKMNTAAIGKRPLPSQAAARNSRPRLAAFRPALRGGNSRNCPRLLRCFISFDKSEPVWNPTAGCGLSAPKQPCSEAFDTK